MNSKYKFLTVREVAKRLQRMKEGEVLDFTFDNEEMVQEPIGWFGFKKITIFDEPYGNICMGDYGASATRIHSLQENTAKEIAEIIQFWLEDESGYTIDKLCVEIPVVELWKEFGEVPMNPDTEEIVTEWNGFPAGTHREEIWYWFEETFNVSFTEELMGM